MAHVLRELGVVLVFVMLTAAMTWPLARNMNRAVADPGDPYINTFILAWTHHALTHEPRALYHPPIFHPHRYTIAFSENLFGIALITLPLAWAGLDPLLIYNVAFFAGFVFTGWAACLLGRLGSGSLLGGMAAGVFFAFLPWRFVHLSQLQHQWAGGLALIIAALLMYWRGPSRIRAIAVAAAFAINGSMNLHWFAFSLVASPAAALVLGARSLQRSAWRDWLRLVAAFTIGCVALLPLLLPYLSARRLYGSRTATEDPSSWSARPGDWLAGAPDTIYSRLMETGVPEPERWLFPGFLPLLICFLFVARFAARPSDAPARSVVTGILLVILGFWGSLGADGGMHGWLAAALPVFEGIRTPARWAMIAYLGMLILIAVAIGWLAKRGRRVFLLALIVTFAMAVELRRAPLRYWLAPPGPDTLTSRAHDLRDQIVLAWLPLDQRSQYRRMLDASRHLAPMINGVSGFAPGRYRELEQQYVSGRLDPSFTEKLLALGANAVVVSPDALHERAGEVRAWARQEIENGRLLPLAVFPSGGVTGEFAFSLSAESLSTAEPPPREIAAWLEDIRVPPSAFAFGFIDEPYPNQQVEGNLRVFGWALAKRPIERVTLHFDNGTRAIEAVRSEHPAVRRRFAGYEHEPFPAFSISLPFEERVRENTDLEVEVTTVDGRSERFGYRWFDWRAPNEVALHD